MIVLVWSTLNHFIYEWSDSSPGVAWEAATDESVMQHLKMMLWPWLFTLLPFDLCWRAFSPRNSMGIYGRAWPSMATIVASNAACLCVGMLVMSVLFAIAWYASGQQEMLALNIIIFMICVVGAQVLRLWLFRFPDATTILLASLMLYGLVWLFTYISYRDDLREGFWFDPHEPSS